MPTGIYQHKPRTEETRRKISEAHRGKYISEETRGKMSEAKRGKPHSEETRQKMSIALKGNKNSLGRKHSEEIRRKISEANKGRISAMKGKHHSEEARKKLSMAMRGEKSNGWKGGVTPINAKIRDSLEYKLWREAIFKRDNFTCQWCRQVGGNKNVDHIKMFAFYPELRFDINNGRTLCENCHAWKTRMDIKIYMGKVPELNFVI